MKMIVVALLLVLTLMLSCVTGFAYTSADLRTADALNELGLFQGMGGNKGYALDEGLTRAQGMTLLVRMIGKEAEAQNGTYTNKFTDVPTWAKGYVGYAYANGITQGRSETVFDPDGGMTDYMFLTLTLRALGYSDSGINALYTWDKPYDVAYDLGLINRAVADTTFTRADAVQVFWNAMYVEINGTDDTLSDELLDQGIFTDAQWENAQDIQAYGYVRDDDEEPEEKTEKPVEDNDDRTDDSLNNDQDEIIEDVPTKGDDSSVVTTPNKDFTGAGGRYESPEVEI